MSSDSPPGHWTTTKVWTVELGFGSGGDPRQEQAYADLRPEHGRVSVLETHVATHPRADGVVVTVVLRAEEWIPPIPKENSQ